MLKVQIVISNPHDARKQLGILIFARKSFCLFVFASYTDQTKNDREMKFSRYKVVFCFFEKLNLTATNLAKLSRHVDFCISLRLPRSSLYYYNCQKLK